MFQRLKCGNTIQADNVRNAAYRTLVPTASCIPPDIQALREN